MKHKFSDEQVAAWTAKFPEKYQLLVKKAIFIKGLGVPFELLFSDYQDQSDFILLFKRKEFLDIFPEEFSIGICTKCPGCGLFDFSGAMGFDLIEVNANRIRQMIELNGEIVNLCITCLIKMFGASGLKEHCQQTNREVNAVRGQWDDETKKTVH